MAVRQLPSGKWLAVIKYRGQYVESKAFRTKREAVGFDNQRKAELAGNLDPTAAKVTVAHRLDQWLEARDGSVAPKTYRADADLRRLLPRWFLAMQVRHVGQAEIERLLREQIRLRAHGSVVRLRASLSAFFADCQRSRLIAANPVTGVRTPRRQDEAVEMRPFPEHDLDDVANEIRHHNARLGDVVLVAGWTGLRWGELRSLRVGDFVEVPSPALIVRRSHTEGQSVKTTKSGRSRRVPVANKVLPIIRAMAHGRGPDDLLVTTDRGKQLHAGAFKRTTQWSQTGRGRRIHDLRHSAACLFIARGVDLVTVQAWMGHADIATTNRYLHHLGSVADRAGLNLLNESRATDGQVTWEEDNAANEE